MDIRFVFALGLVTATAAFSADWDAKRAEQYMDSRQKQWIAWPTALRSGVACVSCHTGMPYLLSRPRLRKSLGEKNGPTLYESVLLDSVRATVIRTDASDLFPGLKGRIVDQVYGAQSIVAAFAIAIDDSTRTKLSPEGERAFERIWSTQLKSGADGGAWLWSDFDLDPWETKESAYYGAALAALATGMAPANYQGRPEIQENIAALRNYLRDGEAGQPLHNRLFMLWAGSKLRDLLPESKKQELLEAVWRAQEPDGGWTLASLGPWRKRDAAPVATGSNSYATALTAFTLEQAGVRSSQPGMAKALIWLKTHQQAEGYWAAESMNHKHDAGTMPDKFMSDAATGYAVSALLDGESEPAQMTAVAKGSK